MAIIHFVLEIIVICCYITLNEVDGIGIFASSQAVNLNPHFGRQRRSLESGSSKSCENRLDKEAEKKILLFSYPLKNDRNMDLQLVYLGNNSETQVLMTSMTSNFVNLFFTQHKSSNLYQSTDGGRTFQKIMKKIGSASIRSTYGIMKSPLDPNRVILISYTASSIFGIFSSFTQSEQSVLLVSHDAGKNFTSIKLPFKLRENEPLLFHPKRKDWIIALEQKRTIINIGIGEKHYGQAWISKDFGKTWKTMMIGHVASAVKWGAAEGKEGEEIYLATHIKDKRSFFSLFSLSSTSTLTLWKSSDGGNFFEEIIEHCYNFGVEGDFVFASVTFKDSNNAGHQKRIMHVSKDSGVTFRPVNVPVITSDRFYAVLEMHKGMIFLHVDEYSATGKGTLYISGSDGIMYTKSLENHFYTDGGFTDFSRIESMHGVYITQVLQSDKTLKSVITFDRGVTWNSLYVDKKKYCKNVDEPCTLHFHKDYSRAHRHVDVQPPLSSANAPGIIFMHGQAGDALTGSAQVWLSINGGYNWTKVADGPHHYVIGDNGNLLIIVPRLNNTGNILLYSIDQGRCWHKYKFSDDNQELVIRGLVTEPHAQQRTFSLWGYYKNVPDNQKQWNVVTVSFQGMFSKQCASDDFVEWSPHILNKKSGCFLGEKLFFRKPKLDATCYLGKDFNAYLRNEKCKCDKDDLECDYGFERQSDGTCKENKSIKPIEVCRKGEKMKERFSKGYRRVPGDVCESKEAVDDVVKFIDEHTKCSSSKEDAFGIIKQEKVIMANEKKDSEHTEDVDVSGGAYATNVVAKPHRKKGVGYFIVIAVLIAIGVVIGGGWYVVKFIRNKRRYQTTIFSEVNDELENSDILYNPKPKTERHYQDESDADDDVLLPV